MRIIVFSDVQGNSLALEALLTKVTTLPDFEANILICLGDVACGYAPNRVLDLLRQHHVLCVRGNMDDVLLNPTHYVGNDDDEKHYNAMDRWASLHLSSSNRAYLQHTLPSIVQTYHGKNYFFAHGSPDNYDVPLDFTMPESDLEKFMPDNSDVLITGHTHQQFLVPVSDKTLVNPGSIGFPDPLSNGKRPLHAEFAIIEKGHIQLHRLNYNPETFIQRVQASGMPHTKWYLNQWQLKPD